MKSRFWKVAAVFSLAAVVAAWLVFKKASPLSPADSHETESSSKPLAAQPAQPASAPREPLPVAGTDFSSDSTDDELLQLARKLVARSPDQALAWAQSQNDPELRERLLFAVLRAWGERDPRAAVHWALRQDETRRFVNLEAALNGAATQPELALQVGRELLAQDSETAGAGGSILVGALSAAGNFQAALQFASQGPADSRADWLANVFRRWGEAHPDEAVRALDGIDQKESRDAAFQALVAGWATGNPSGLAAYAVKLPAGDQRAGALNAALENWSLQDPAGVGEWLNDFPASPELDAAIARLVTRTDSVNRSPEVALSWVESIGDPKLRRETLERVMQEWVPTDSAAAWKYFKAIPWLGEQERDELQKTIQKKIAASNVP